MRARHAPAGRCGALSIALYSPPGVRNGPMVGLGWLGLVEFDVDRPRSRATDGHSVNACASRTDYRVLATRRKTHTAKSAPGPAKAAR